MIQAPYTISLSPETTIGKELQLLEQQFDCPSHAGREQGEDEALPSEEQRADEVGAGRREEDLPLALATHELEP